MGATGLTIMVEPGRSIVGSAGVLLTRVLHRKKTPGKEFVVVDAAMNDLIRPALYKAHHEILPLRWAAARRHGRGRGGADLRNRRLSGARPADARRATRASFWLLSSAGLTVSCRLRTTIPGPARRKCWWREIAGASCASGKTTKI